MAAIELRPDLIASRLEGLATGPVLAYSFETQEGVPVDGGSQLFRLLSPFTLRLIPPDIQVPGRSGANVNLIASAFSSNDVYQSNAKEVRSLYGVGTVVGSGQAPSLQQIVSAGQVSSGVETNVERTVLVDRRTAADIAYQVDLMLRVPPLTMLVNPREMSIQYTSVQQFSDRTRRGYVFERWGEGQPTISFSGSTGAFIAGANPVTGQGPLTQKTQSPTGVQFASKRDSAAWQNFAALCHFYRNNGYIYDTINKTEAHLAIGSVAINYDQITYVGHIEDLTYGYDQANPHRVEWSMSFVVSRMYDSAQAPFSVAPQRSPNPSPSWPGGREVYSEFTGPDLGEVSESPQFAETPLDLLYLTGR